MAANSLMSCGVAAASVCPSVLPSKFAATSRFAVSQPGPCCLNGSAPGKTWKSQGISKAAAAKTAAVDINFRRRLMPECQTRRKHICRVQCYSGVPVSLCGHELYSSTTALSSSPLAGIANKISHSGSLERLVLVDLDPATAKLAIGFLGPFFSAFGFLFILRIVMSWYPKLPVDKFPYIIAYAPTEPLLVQTRKLIPPLAGVDVTPVVWFGLLSFLNEILVGPQGLLVLLSQKV